METNLSNRIQAILLALATVGLILLAILNFRQETSFAQPTDQVWWSEAPNGEGLIALRVLPVGPGQIAGLKTGDLLTAVNDHPVHHGSDLVRELYKTGSYGQAFYTITRDGIAFDTPVHVIPVPVDRSLALGLRVIGLIYLAIGFYVLFRRWGAPRATHFYLFCLVSFALYALKYTSKLDRLDSTVFWTNIVAESLQPALFLHFALSFPEERLRNVHRGWLLPVIYAPGVALLGLWIWAITYWEATLLLKHRMDQTGVAYEAVFYVLAAGAVSAQLRPRLHAAAAPAAEVAHPRSAAGGGALHALLRGAVSFRLALSARPFSRSPDSRWFSCRSHSAGPSSVTG